MENWFRFDFIEIYDFEREMLSPIEIAQITAIDCPSGDIIWETQNQISTYVTNSFHNFEIITFSSILQMQSIKICIFIAITLYGLLNVANARALGDIYGSIRGKCMIIP